MVDGFDDKTYERALKHQNELVRVFGYKHNKGKGYAIRYGMARTLGDYVAFIDSGMEVNPNGISMILEHMVWYDADIIVGSKRHPVSKVNYPFTRKIYSWGYYMLIWLLFRVKLRDTQTGLKVYKRKVLEDVLPRMLIKRYAFDIELLAVAHRLGYKKIYEAPVILSYGFDNPRIKKFLFLEPYIRGMLIDTLAVFYRMYILHYYDSTNNRKWIYDKELEMQVNTGEMA